MSGPLRFGAVALAAALLISLGRAQALAQAGPPAAQTVAPPAAAPRLPATNAQALGTLSLSAIFAGEAKPIRSGLAWRVFEEDVEGRPRIVAKSAASAPSVTLPPGPYIVHVAYGFASASKRVSVTVAGTTERIAIGAGALKLGGAIGDLPIPANRMAFSIYLPVGTDSEGRLIAGNVKPGEVIGLPEGSYHVVSTYGESNAVMRVDLRVDAGKLTEAVVNHRAATVTLKLVAAPAGEAFAGTAFSVLTPGGDVIREAIGAFPTMTLAEGDYVAIARHDGSVYTRDFKVESGLDRDIEVLAAKTP